MTITRRALFSMLFAAPLAKVFPKAPTIWIAGGATITANLSSPGGSAESVAQIAAALRPRPLSPAAYARFIARQEEAMRVNYEHFIRSDVGRDFMDEMREAFKPSSAESP